MSGNLPILEHAGLLPDLEMTPGHVMPDHQPVPQIGRISCSFCGVGDSGVVVQEPVEDDGVAAISAGAAQLHIQAHGTTHSLNVSLRESGSEGIMRLDVPTTVEITPTGGVLTGHLQQNGAQKPITAREIERDTEGGGLRAQAFHIYKRALSVMKSSIKHTLPTTGCIKLKLSQNKQRAAFPFHSAPTILNPDGTRTTITYAEAIDRFADMLLAHRRDLGNTLLYCSGQLDYFAIYAIQEVYRLLGVRNLTGNAEHCLNAGAVHNEILTGQEGPFLTLDQATTGPNRVYIFNGWNGFITHPPAFSAISRRDDFDAFLIEVQVTETAKAVAKKLGADRILLVKPKSDPHIALSVAHELFTNYRNAIEGRFIERFSDKESYTKYYELAMEARFAPERVAERCAPEPKYVERLHNGIRMIAAKLAQQGTVPINIPSVGLSQTTGVVAHCLWGSALAMLGKYGLYPNGAAAGGTMRIPGQVNAQSEVQGLSRKYFMGRIRIPDRVDVARRNGLPDDAYEEVAKDNPRAALDYSEPTPDEKELFVFVGTQFESNMMNRKRFLRKLKDPNTTNVVIDPIPDPWTIANVDLIIPPPPHSASTKVYQNGEWKMSVSTPQKQAPPETRSDATITYDVMAAIATKLAQSPPLAQQHDDLNRLLTSGYLQARFCPPRDGVAGLARIDGEVSRPLLWNRVIEYMNGGSGPLYCRPEHSDGRAIQWHELLEAGSIIYGGVGTHRFMLNYDDPNCVPFRDIFRKPGLFKFFHPTEADLHMPGGIILNSGRSGLMDDRKRIRYATTSFNSGKATPIVDMPDDNPLFISPTLAEKLGLKDGSWAKVTNRYSGESETWPVKVSDRVKGDTTYISFHKCGAEISKLRYVNTVTAHEGRCAYSGQTSVKASQVLIEPASEPATAAVGAAEPVIEALPRLDTTQLDPAHEHPIWDGQNTQLFVTDIRKETHDVFTFSFQGDPPCRFVYKPGQFCSLVLNINGKKVVRSYTISSTPSRPFSLAITVKRVPGGLVSNWLPDNLKVGSRIEIAGPKGKFCLEPGKVPKKILLLAAGSGVTPSMSIARWLCDINADVDINFLNCVRSPDDIIFQHEIEMMTKRYKVFSAVNVSSTRDSPQGWTGLSGRVSPDMFKMLVPDLLERTIYMCGPPGYMEAVKKMMAGPLEFPMENFNMESFGGVRTSTKNKQGPVGAGDVKADALKTGGHSIEFAKSGVTAMVDGETPLLDLAEENDVDINYACRSGSCGECKVRLLKGDVDMAEDEGLEASDKKEGYVLACVATAKGPCVVDA
jgi:ferredoxin-NADP reductase/anaerobic selenocysteine-containing dehydrogenase